MSSKKSSVNITPPSTEQLVEERKEGLSLISRIKPSIQGMTINSREDYKKADVYIGVIKQGRKSWSERMARILDPLQEALNAAKRAKAGATELFNDIDAPLAELESHTKSLMRDYLEREDRKIAEAEETRKKELAKLEAEARAKEESQDKAKSQALRNRILEQRARLQQQISDTKAAPVAEAVTGEHSQRRTRTVAVVTDATKLLQHIVAQLETRDLTSLVSIDTVQLNALFKIDKPPVGEWMPGVVVKEEIIIAGKR